MKRLPLFALILSLSLLTTVPALAQTEPTGPNDPSPGGATFPVIAQGISELPADQVAWRVVLDTAALPADAETLERALGFVIADEDAILITDADGVAQQRLAAAEAAFVPEGVTQQHASLGDGPTPYFRIALVPPADAEFTAGGELVLAGDAFDSAPGLYDIDLMLGDISKGKTETLVNADFPTVVLALTDGLAISPAEGGGAPEILDAGEATIVSGQRELNATGAGAAIFVAARIGPDVSTVEAD